MSFVVFLILLAGLPSVIVWLLAKRLYRRGRRRGAYFLIVGYASLLIAWIITEYVLISFKGGIEENPWFIWADSKQSSAGAEVPFRRKPNMDWRGMAHGDLAVLNGDPDPYAREVHYMTDADGFRNHRPISTAEVVILGDSYTEAGNLNIEDTYVSLLAAASGKSVKNLATSGYTTPLEVLNFIRYGKPLQPRVAILQVAESNDLTEAAIYYDWVKNGRKAWPLRDDSEEHADNWRLRSLSYGLYQKLFPLPLNEYPLEGFQKDEEGNEFLIRVLRTPGSGMIPERNLGWEVIRGSLMRFSEECHSNGIRPVVILVPDKVNVIRDVVRWKEGIQKLLEANPPIPRELQLSTFLTQTCQANRLDFVDATQSLKAATQRGDLVYLPMDTHLSAAGHKILAELLLPFIR